MTTTGHVKGKPIAASVVAGLLASFCCGGSLIFTSIGLGVFFSTFGLARYVPQALAAGAVSILAINYLYYCRAAKQEPAANRLWRTMFISTAIGLAAMAGSFILMEWLNHAVVHGNRFLVRPEYGEALIKGVPNTTLLYVGATFSALAVLWALPFPGRTSSGTKYARLSGNAMRVAVFGATTVLLFGVVLDASNKISGAWTEQHGHAH
jgi:hypothetical protein